MALTSISTQQQLTFTQFLEKLSDEAGRYELVNVEIVRTLPTRQHEDIADFIADAFKNEVKRCDLNYQVSDRIVIRTLTPTGTEQGRQPDVSVVDKTLWNSNLSAYTAFIEPLQVAVEVVSTNWEDDYVDKLDEYQRLGIVEYWIVDYLAIASRSYLGNPKIPTIFIYQLDNTGIYQRQSYQGLDLILSPTFPELQLTVEQILNV